MESNDDNLLLNIKNSIKTNDKKSDKKTEIQLCNGAVKYNTIGDAYKAIIDNKIKVYIYETIKNGKVNEIAYARCSKKAEDNDCVCHLHRRMRSTNPKGIKYFDKDILPYVNNNINDSGVKIRLASINDSYFDNMGKRGAKKKNKNTVIDFKNPNHPIILAYHHKNPKILQDILIYIRKLLKLNQEEDDKEIYPKKIDKKENKESTNLDLINTIKLLKESNIKQDDTSSIDNESKNDIDFQKDDEDENDDASTNDLESNKSDILEDEELDSEEYHDKEEEIIYDKENNDLEKISEINDDEEIIENNSRKSENDDDSEIEDVDVVKISTMKGRDVYLDENTNLIYDTQDGYDSDISIGSNESYTSKPLGKLTKINEKFATIELNNCFYTVLSTIVNNDLHYSLCVFTNKLFDNKLNHVGNIKEKRNSDEIIFDIFKNKKSFNIKR